MNKVKITERGWAGHFICAHDCRFRRNTLIESGRRRIVVSTVGNLVIRRDGKEMDETIGWLRNYETMAFRATKDGGYWDADVSRQVYFDSPRAIEKLTNKSDERANQMHEAVVKELADKMRIK